MRLGVAFIECVRPERETLLRALDAWAVRTGRMPDLLPVWSVRSADGWLLDPTLLSGIRERGVEPVIYAESTGATYDDILAGRHDAELRSLATRADGHVLRWDQEPDGDFGQAWSRHPLYSRVFAHVATVLRSEANIRMWWCPVQPGSAVMAGFWPGNDHVDILGFDRYSWHEDGTFPRWQWKLPVRQLRELGTQPIWVAECGRKAGLTRRAAWLREAASVPGVDAAVLWDMFVPAPFFHDWRWTRFMDRAYRES